VPAVACRGDGDEKNRATCGEKPEPEILFNQGLIDPDRFFNHDHDRDDFFSIKV
jgi:hypothetical protein